jgi:hypothetical protein
LAAVIQQLRVDTCQHDEIQVDRSMGKISVPDQSNMMIVADREIATQKEMFVLLKTMCKGKENKSNFNKPVLLELCCVLYFYVL